MSQTPALLVENVAKRFDDTWAVQDLSFSVTAGRICGFLGPNGAGKTTTLRMILGLAPPSRGRVLVLGSADIRAVRDRIGFLPEERGLYRRLSALDAIVFFGRLKGMGKTDARRRAMALLEEQGLGFAAHRKIKALSKGMAQKVQFLSSIVHGPDLVLLDEPFSGLDPVNQQALETQIRGLADRGATVLFSTHVMQHAERLCDQVVLLAKGRKMFDGNVADARAAAPRRLVVEGAIDGPAVLALPGVRSIQSSEPAPGGARVVAVLDQGAAQNALRAAFERGLDIRSFEVKEPTLHDAFIVLTGEPIETAP
ncbi:MAG: ATP-binding cassette domain-containing protein [Caulobacteraceae bacterium]